MHRNIDCRGLGVMNAKVVPFIAFLRDPLRSTKIPGSQSIELDQNGVIACAAFVCNDKDILLY